MTTTYTHFDRNTTPFEARMSGQKSWKELYLTLATPPFSRILSVSTLARCDRHDGQDHGDSQIDEFTPLLSCLTRVTCLHTKLTSLYGQLQSVHYMYI